MKIPIVGPSYQMDARSFDVQRTINLYPILSEVRDSKDVVALKKCPGMSIYTTVGGGPIRGGITTARGRCFVVSGFDLYEITTSGNVNHGSLNSATNRVSIAENGDQVMIVDGVDGYIFTQSTDTFAQIADGDFPASNTVVFLDGYFIVNKVNSAAFYISALNDGTSWGAADFAVMSSNPDNLLGLTADRGNLWGFGNRSVEVFDNTGNATFPFERIDGSVIPTGCEAPFTIQRADNTIVWLGVDEQGRGVVWKAEGYNAVKISTQAIDRRIAESVRRDESYAWVYHQQGHAFYCLQVKGLDTTLVYDFSTRQWHERSFKNADLNAREQHRGSCHFVFDNKNLVGDRQNGNIYELSLNYYDDYGEELIWERISPHYDQEKALIRHSRLELDCEVGRVSGDHRVAMRYSDDGGFEWSSWLWTSLGQLGKYKTRVRWNRLGSSRDRVYHIKGSSNAPFQLNEAFLNGA